MKKILSLVLAMLMVFSIVPAVLADDEVTTTAAKESAYQDAIDFLGLIDLYQGGHPDDEAVTRWQMALFVSRALTGRTDNAYWKTTENNSGFYDVDEYLNDTESYIVGAVSYAANAGIINGYGDGTFGPNDGITYRDALVMAVRALGFNYPASGYPWSYVTKADELGLMDGITGVGQTEEITREVVAQILFNAVTAEIDETTLAEKTFGVGTMTVMVTASNDVAYDGSSYVYRSDYIQFMEIDDQADPTGAKYHIAASKFNLNDRNAQNAAVGTNYQLVYKDNCVDVLAVKPLWTTFENFGDAKHEIEITTDKTWFRPTTGNGNSYDGSVGAYFMKLGNGVRTELVSFYTDLFNSQGEFGYANMAGEPEMKVYGAANIGEWNTVGAVYYMDAQGYIYQRADLKIVAYYFDFFDALYACTVSSTGMYEYAPISPALAASIRADLITPANGFAQINSFIGLEDSAYAKVTASDANNDGVYDRALLRNYMFGYIDYNGDTNFTVYTKSGLNALGNTKTYAVKTTAYANNDYRFTGKCTKTDGYAIFYIDEINHELDVAVEIPEYTEGATTYWSTGYMLGFSVSGSKMYIDDTKADRRELGFGYTKNCGLLGSPLVPFEKLPANNTSNTIDGNKALIDLFLATQHEYIEYVVVDNQVVYFQPEGDMLDYVVIDHFVDISEENGVVAHAYTTVTDSWEDITIAEFDGWNLASFDWETKWYEAIKESILAGNGVPGATDLLATFLPINTDELYRVVYTTDKGYNLRSINTATDIIDGVNRLHVENGNLHWFNGSSAVNMDNFVKFPNAEQVKSWLKTATEHDWLILQAEAVKDDQGNFLYYDYASIDAVYVVPGKLANTFVPKFDLYKFTDNDFVLISDAANLSNLVEVISVGGSSAFVYYEKYDLVLNDHNNEWADPWSFNVGDFHYYYRWMRDVATGNHVLVKIDVADYAAVIAGLEAIDATVEPENFAILRLSDGVLKLADMDEDGDEELPIVCMNYVADYYDDVNLFECYTAFENVASDALVATVGDYLDRAFCRMEQYVDTNDYFGVANITFIGVDVNGDYIKVAGNKLAAASFDATVNAHVFWNKAEQVAVVYVGEVDCAVTGCICHN